VKLFVLKPRRNSWYGSGYDNAYVMWLVLMWTNLVRDESGGTKRNFLTGWATISFSRTILLHAVNLLVG
jgi:hypothetical protein